MGPRAQHIQVPREGCGLVNSYSCNPEAQTCAASASLWQKDVQEHFGDESGRLVSGALRDE